MSIQERSREEKSVRSTIEATTKGYDMDINWTTIARGRKADKGHTLVAMAETSDDFGFKVRSYSKCQCGKVYSGWGYSAGQYGWQRHFRNEMKKLEEQN